MFDHNVHDNPYHVTLIRSQLTRNIASLFGEIYDEIDQCFGDMVGANEKGKCLVNLWRNGGGN